MDVWISGGFALAGALVGGLLSPFISSSIRKGESKREQLQEAMWRIAELEASTNIVSDFSGLNPPAGMLRAEMWQFESNEYFKGMARYFDCLHEARRAVSVVEANGIPVGKSWDGSIEEFRNDLPRLRAVIGEALRVRKG